MCVLGLGKQKLKCLKLLLQLCFPRSQIRQGPVRPSALPQPLRSLDARGPEEVQVLLLVRLPSATTARGVQGPRGAKVSLFFKLIVIFPLINIHIYTSTIQNSLLGLVWFGFITGPCEHKRLKAQYTVHQTNSMADSLTVRRLDSLLIF